MVGPGTGCAPFRSYIQQQTAEFRDRNITFETPNLHLYFGCRNKDKDDYCTDEWGKYVKENFLWLSVSFSRDQDHKQYVQHSMLETGELIFKILSKGGYFLVAGNAKQMPNDVREAVCKICEKYGIMDSIAAENYVKMLEQSGKYQSETWS